MMRFSTKILPSRCGNVGIIELNNLKSLHALDLDMIRAMTDVLSYWQKDDTLKMTLVTSAVQQQDPHNAEDKKQHQKRNIFCAGGDVKNIYESIHKTNQQQYDHNKPVKVVGYGIPGQLSSDFFREEYTLNYQIATQIQPQVSIWDGIVMGGFKSQAKGQS